MLLELDIMFVYFSFQVLYFKAGAFGNVRTSELHAHDHASLRYRLPQRILARRENHLL